MSLFAALLNLASSFVRLKKIHVLDFSALSISTLLTYLFVDLGQSPSSNPNLSTRDSRLILSLYDWMSLFVSLMFLACAVYNFATVRTLILREREKTSTMWTLGRSLSDTMFRRRTYWSWRSFTSYWTRYSDKHDVLDDEDDKGLDDECFHNLGHFGNHMSDYSLSASIRSRSHSQTLTPSPFFPPSPRQSPRLTKKGALEVKVRLGVGSTLSC